MPTCPPCASQEVLKLIGGLGYKLKRLSRSSRHYIHHARAPTPAEGAGTGDSTSSLHHPGYPAAMSTRGVGRPASFRDSSTLGITEGDNEDASDADEHGAGDDGKGADALAEDLGLLSPPACPPSMRVEEIDARGDRLASSSSSLSISARGIDAVGGAGLLLDRRTLSRHLRTTSSGSAAVDGLSSFRPVVGGFDAGPSSVGASERVGVMCSPAFPVSVIGPTFPTPACT